MGMLKEFRDFAMRGNMVDMAVGIIIGGAFGKIVTSLVNDVVMPPLGKVMGNLNFSDLFFPLTQTDLTTLAEVRKAGIPVFAYGAFITQIIDFVIMALCVFLMVKAMNRVTAMLKQGPPPDPKTKDCPHCYMSIPAKATRCGHCTSQLETKPA